MKREFLKELGLEGDVIDSIMAEYGKSIQTISNERDTYKKELDTSNEKLSTYETELNALKEDSKSNDEWKTKFEELDSKIKEQEKARKAQEEDEILTNNILDNFKDKKFASDYAKNGLISDIKSELSKAENKGKAISEIADYLTKDKTGIFENPNQPATIPQMGNVENESDSKEMPLLW